MEEAHPVGATDFNPTVEGQENSQVSQAQPSIIQPVVVMTDAPSLCTRCGMMAVPFKDSFPDFKTHIIAALLFVIGLPFLCFLPYVFNWYCKPVLRCPRCGAVANMYMAPQ